jgi:hypothetical protein
MHLSKTSTEKEYQSDIYEPKNVLDFIDSLHYSENIDLQGVASHTSNFNRLHGSSALASSHPS